MIIKGRVDLQTWAGRYIINIQSNVKYLASFPCGLGMRLCFTPPVSPNVLSKSGGVRVSHPTTRSLNPGAYCSIVSNTAEGGGRGGEKGRGRREEGESGRRREERKKGDRKKREEGGERELERKRRSRGRRSRGRARCLGEFVTI